MSNRSGARIGSLCSFAVALCVTACGGGDEATNPQGPGAFDAASQPVIDGAVSNPSPISNVPDATTGAQNPGSVDAGPSGITLGGADAAAPRTDAGPIIITIPTRSVVCGSTPCTTTNNRTCCDSWNKDTGFVGTPTCTTNAACTSDHTSFGDANRVVLSDCDEPGDCGTGQVCCFVRYGAPVTVDLFSTDFVGPGTSRLCMELSNCNAGAMSLSGVAGVPVGVVACKSDADCTDGAHCSPEQAGSTTAGKIGPARPGVSVCR